MKNKTATCNKVLLGAVLVFFIKKEENQQEIAINTLKLFTTQKLVN